MLLVAAGCSSNGSDDTNNGALGDQTPQPSPGDAVDAESADDRGSDVPAPPDPTPTPRPTATSTPSPSPEPVATPEPEPTLLLPGDGWQVTSMSTQIVSPPPTSQPSAAAIFGTVNYIATDAGVWGPVIEAHFVPDADYRRIGDPGSPYHDVVTSDDAPVRVRTGRAPFSITAVVAVVSEETGPPSSIVVTSYDVSESDLLSIVDGLTVDSADQIKWSEADLPGDLKIVSLPVERVEMTQYQLQRGESEHVSLFTVPAEQWQMPLLQRAMHLEAEPTEVAGFPALIYGYDQRSRDGAGALYTDGKLIYILGGPGFGGPSSPTIDDVRAQIDSLQPVEVGDIAHDLGMVPRAPVFEAWIDGTPLPPGIDLAWMLDGPPVFVEHEAFWAHQVFGCLWAGLWIESGNISALDQIATSADWPTGQVLTETGMGAADIFNYSLIEARSITSGEARSASNLALDCSFILGPAGPPGS